MNTTSNFIEKPTRWHNVILFSLAFWLSSSLLLDFLIMPGLFMTGMMSQSDFGTAGYSLFWAFNRLELLCGAFILTGLFALRQARNTTAVCVSGTRSRWAVEIAVGLILIGLAYTYVLTPAMGAMGIPLDLFQPNAIPLGMNQLHALYWGLEVIKLLGLGFLLRLSYGDMRTADAA